MDRARKAMTAAEVEMRNRAEEGEPEAPDGAGSGVRFREGDGAHGLEVDETGVPHPKRTDDREMTDAEEIASSEENVRMIREEMSELAGRKDKRAKARVAELEKELKAEEEFLEGARGRTANVAEDADKPDLDAAVDAKRAKAGAEEIPRENSGDGYQTPAELDPKGAEKSRKRRNKAIERWKQAEENGKFTDHELTDDYWKLQREASDAAFSDQEMRDPGSVRVKMTKFRKDLIKSAKQNIHDHPDSDETAFHRAVIAAFKGEKFSPPPAKGRGQKARRRAYRRGWELATLTEEMRTGYPEAPAGWTARKDAEAKAKKAEQAENRRRAAESADGHEWHGMDDDALVGELMRIWDIADPHKMGEELSRFTSYLGREHGGHKRFIEAGRKRSQAERDAKRAADPVDAAVDAKQAKAEPPSFGRRHVASASVKGNYGSDGTMTPEEKAASWRKTRDDFKARKAAAAGDGVDAAVDAKKKKAEEVNEFLRTGERKKAAPAEDPAAANLRELAEVEAILRKHRPRKGESGSETYRAAYARKVELESEMDVVGGDGEPLDTDALDAAVSAKSKRAGEGEAEDAAEADSRAGAREHRTMERKVSDAVIAEFEDLDPRTLDLIRWARREGERRTERLSGPEMRHKDQLAVDLDDLERQALAASVGGAGSGLAKGRLSRAKTKFRKTLRAADDFYRDTEGFNSRQQKRDADDGFQNDDATVKKQLDEFLGARESARKTKRDHAAAHKAFRDAPPGIKKERFETIRGRLQEAKRAEDEMSRLLRVEAGKLKDFGEDRILRMIAEGQRKLSQTERFTDRSVPGTGGERKTETLRYRNLSGDVAVLRKEWYRRNPDADGERARGTALDEVLAERFGPGRRRRTPDQEGAPKGIEGPAGEGADRSDDDLIERITARMAERRKRMERTSRRLDEDAARGDDADRAEAPGEDGNPYRAGTDSHAGWEARRRRVEEELEDATDVFNDFVEAKRRWRDAGSFGARPGRDRGGERDRYEGVDEETARKHREASEEAEEARRAYKEAMDEALAKAREAMDRLDFKSVMRRVGEFTDEGFAAQVQIANLDDLGQVYQRINRMIDDLDGKEGQWADAGLRDIRRALGSVLREFSDKWQRAMTMGRMGHRRREAVLGDRFRRPGRAVGGYRAATDGRLSAADTIADFRRASAQEEGGGLTQEEHIEEAVRRREYWKHAYADGLRQQAEGLGASKDATEALTSSRRQQELSALADGDSSLLDVISDERAMRRLGDEVMRAERRRPDFNDWFWTIANLLRGADQAARVRPGFAGANVVLALRGMSPRPEVHRKIVDTLLSGDAGGLREARSFGRREAAQAAAAARLATAATAPTTGPAYEALR